MHDLIKDLIEKEGQEVRLCGWLQGKRRSGKVIFLLIRDGTGICQCTVEAHLSTSFETAKKLTQESSLILRGKVSRETRSPGGFELAVKEITVLQFVENYPLSRKAHGADFLLSNRHLWLRSSRQTAILRIRHNIISTVRDFFDQQGFTLIDTPIFQPGAAEGSATLFEVDFFGETAYLSQTGQLYLESAAMALGKVYCFGPTFRAEKSKTRRHLTEFWMVEPEWAYAELPDLEDLAEKLIEYIVRSVLEKNTGDLGVLQRPIEPLEKIKTPFPSITYTKAVELLRNEKVHAKLQHEIVEKRGEMEEQKTALAKLEALLDPSQKAWKREKLQQECEAMKASIRELEIHLRNRPVHIEKAQSFQWGQDFGGDVETILSELFDSPLIITEYPEQVKAFYMKRSPDKPDRVLNMDVLAPEGYGEIIGGSQREDDLEALEERMEKEKMDPAPYQWYLDLRRYGTVPHGGFGLGIERTVAWICGLKHVRETIPFPRLMGRMTP